MTPEGKFKKKFKKDFLAVRPDVVIFEPDASRRRSDPDMLIIDGDGERQIWAALEFKESEDADHQPNQDYRVEKLSKKGYASFVYPENAEEVFHELEQLFPA